MQRGTVSADPFDPLWDRLQVEQPEVFAASRARLHALAKLAGGSPPVLNIGIGAGFVEAELVRRGTPVYTVDPSERSVSQLKSRLAMADRARVGRVEQLPFADDFFGAVVISEVMEHLTDDVLLAGLAEIQRVLRPGGILLGSVPARERLVEQSVECPHCERQFHRWGHYQSFDCGRMRALLAERFRVDQVFERPFVCWETLNWKGRIASAAKLALYRLGIHGSGENIVFQATKVGQGNASAPHLRLAQPVAG